MLSPEAVASEALHGTGVILLIDDDENVRETAKTILEECGYTVHTAADGYEGIEFYRVNSAELSLVILDMSMPKLSGKETFIELHKINSAITVLLSSGFKQDRLVQETMELGVLHFIQKPYSMKELAEKVSMILSEQ